MRNRKASCKLIYFISLLALLVLPWQIPANSETLQAGIELSKTLPPVAPSLRTGAKFNEANLPAIGTSHGWYWVPSWFAGKWRRENETRILRFGVKKVITSRVEGTMGHQHDRNGEVWNHHQEPYRIVVDCGTTMDWKIVLEQKPLLVTNNEVVLYYRSNNIVVNKWSGVINRVYQQEHISVHRLDSAGTILVEGPEREFDQFGRPVSDEKRISQMFRVLPYSPSFIDPVTATTSQFTSFQKFSKNFGLAFLVSI